MCLDQHDRVNIEVLLLGNRPSNGIEDLLDDRRVAFPLDLLDDDQSLPAINLGAKCRCSSRPRPGMASLDRRLDVVGVDISPLQDDQVLEASGDEKVAIAQEAQVACPQEPQ